MHFAESFYPEDIFFSLSLFSTGNCFMWITTKFNVRNWFEKHLMCSLCSQSSMISLTRFHAGCLNVLLAQPREDKLHPCCILILIEDFPWHWGHSGSYCRFSLVLNMWPLKSIISPFFKIHYLLLLTSTGLHAVCCCHVVEKHYFLHCLGKQLIVDKGPRTCGCYVVTLTHA